MKKHLATRVFFFLTCFILCAVLSSCSLRKPEKKQISSLVMTHLDELNDLVFHRGEEFTDETNDIHIEYYELQNLAVFQCGAEGVGPDGIYYGFYHTEEDQPFAQETITLQKDGDGFSWHQDDPGNMWYYTEKIAPHWYYYAYAT